MERGLVTTFWIAWTVSIAANGGWLLAGVFAAVALIALRWPRGSFFVAGGLLALALPVVAVLGHGREIPGLLLPVVGAAAAFVVLGWFYDRNRPVVLILLVAMVAVLAATGVADAAGLTGRPGLLAALVVAMAVAQVFAVWFDRWSIRQIVRASPQVKLGDVEPHGVGEELHRAGLAPVAEISFANSTAASVSITVHLGSDGTRFAEVPTRGAWDVTSRFGDRYVSTTTAPARSVPPAPAGHLRRRAEGDVGDVLDAHERNVSVIRETGLEPDVLSADEAITAVIESTEAVGRLVANRPLLQVMGDQLTGRGVTDGIASLRDQDVAAWLE